MTRRTAIGTAAAAAAGAAVPRAVEGRSAAGRRRKPKVRHADVIVVGAGLAGMTAANAIRNGGRSVLVLEARDRVGGRTYSTRIGETPWFVERGGEALLQPQYQRATIELARAVGLEPYQRRDTGNNIYFRHGTRTLHDRHGPSGRTPPDPAALPELVAAIPQLDRMAEEVPPDDPWNAPNAEEWDGQTFETWKRAHCQNENSRFLLDVLAEAFFGAMPRDFSLLFALAELARWKMGPPEDPTDPRQQSKTQRLIETYGDFRFPQGIQHISIRLAERLGIGRRVFLETPVRQIVQERKRVRVISDRVTATAKLVIVAMPPFLTAYIRYDPPLPAQRAQLPQRFPQGAIVKCHAIYDAPFWRDDGLSGEVIGDRTVRIAGAGTPPDGSPGVMVGFVTGDSARALVQRPPDERRRAVLDDFAAFFGPKALKPVEFFDLPWASEVWTRGGQTGSTPPGVLLKYGTTIREPVGRVHWSGSETALEYTGSVEGAIRSGLDTAGQVLKRL